MREATELLSIAVTIKDQFPAESKRLYEMAESLHKADDVRRGQMWAASCVGPFGFAAPLPDGKADEAALYFQMQQQYLKE